MGYKTVEHRFLVCDWCGHEDEYGEHGRSVRPDAKRELPDWLIGRTHYKTNRGEAPVTLCPSCAKIYEVATQGIRTPKGVRFRAHMDTFFACENIIAESVEAAKHTSATNPLTDDFDVDDDDDSFGD